SILEEVERIGMAALSAVAPSALAVFGAPGLEEVGVAPSAIEIAAKRIRTRPMRIALRTMGSSAGAGTGLRRTWKCDHPKWGWTVGRGRITQVVNNIRNRSSNLNHPVTSRDVT